MSVVLGVAGAFLRRAAGRAAARSDGDPPAEGHAVEVEPVSGVRAERRHAHGGGDPVGQQRGAGEGVRAAAGAAHDREPVHAERVGDRGGVAGGRGDGAVRPWGGAAVAGAVVGDPADAERLGGGEERLGRRTDVGRAVVPEDHEVAARRCRTRAASARRPAGRRSQPP